MAIAITYKITSGDLKNSRTARVSVKKNIVISCRSLYWSSKDFTIALANNGGKNLIGFATNV